MLNRVFFSYRRVLDCHIANLIVAVFQIVPSTRVSTHCSRSTLSLKNQGKRPSLTVFINHEPKSETWKNALLTGKNASASSTETSEDSSMGVENGRRMSLTNNRNSKKNNNTNLENIQTPRIENRVNADVFYDHNPPPSAPRHTISYQPGAQPMKTADRIYNDNMVNDVMNEVGLGENGDMNDQNGSLRRLDSGYFRQNNEVRSRGNSVSQQVLNNGSSNNANNSVNNSMINSAQCSRMEVFP